MQSVDELARTITALAPTEQQALIDKVAQLNFQKGLHRLGRRVSSTVVNTQSLRCSALVQFNSRAHTTDFNRVVVEFQPTMGDTLSTSRKTGTALFRLKLKVPRD